MALDSRGAPPLPPSPLSRLTETVDPARVPLSWMTPFYTAIAYAPQVLPLALHMGVVGPVLVAHAVTAAQGAVLGLALVAADRLAPNRPRLFRWTAGLILVVLPTYGLGMAWIGVSSGGLQTFGAQMAFLSYAQPALTWVLLGVAWGLAGASLTGIWWKLPAAGATIFVISAAVRLVARWALWPAGQGAPPGPQYVLEGLLLSSLTGALLGLAVAAGLDHGRRAIEASE